MGGDPDDPSDPDRTVYSPRSKPASPPPADEAPDTANETVFSPVSRRPSAGSRPDAVPAGATADASLPPGGAAMRYGAAQVEIGMILNGIYAVKRLIGRGGMGEVYEGVNVNDAEDRVAIKVILPSLAADPNVQAMFFKEARALRTLSHPAVVQYRVVAQEPSIGIFYIVTEFIDGPSLSELLGQSKLTSAELRSLLRRLAEGLRAAHEVGAVHRDMSPDNVLLPAGRLTSAKVIDFGIAKDLDTSKRTIIGDGFAGKLGYVAPEQLGDFGRDIGAWTDVYSLGLVMLSLIHGRNVDMGATLVDAVDRRRAGIDLGEVPPDLKPVLQAMLEVNPAQRLRSMDAVLAALESGVALPSPKSKAPARSGGRPPMALIAGGGAAALVVLLAGLAFVLLGKPSRPAQSAALASSAAVASSAASARRAIEAGLPAIPCSWLRLVGASDTPNGVSVKLSGVAGSTIDAQAAVSRIVGGAGVHAADLDFGDVNQIGQVFCPAVDAFSAFRSDTDASQVRLKSAQTKYTMAPDKDQKLVATAVIDIRIGDPTLSVALVGIDESGQVGVILPDRQALKGAVASKVIQEGVGDTYTMPLHTWDAGWSGLMLVTGRTAVDVGLLSTPPEKRDAAWRERLRQAARAGGWQSEMVWYQSVKPGG